MATGSTPTRSVRHVSVLICTRNREHQIERAVRSVLSNHYPSFELTVIDQSTTHGTRLALAHLLASDVRLRYEHSAEAGLSRAYNAGIANTSGEILAFTDDDCVAGVDWISCIVAAFDEQPDAELLYGEVVAFGDTHDDFLKTPSLTFDRAKRLTKRDHFHVVGMGANFAARRSLFERVGPFDNVLGGGGALRSAQDFDLVYRVLIADGVVLLRPEVSIRHDGRREAEDWPGLLEAYGTGEGAFYTKHIRCRDPRALWMLSKRLGRQTAKWAVRRAQRRQPTERFFVRGMLVGIRRSFEFGVDRERRLYIEP